MNTIGHIFRLTSFGESHGPAIGGVIDGMPAGIQVDYEFLQSELNRRKPGQSKITTARKEDDHVEILSGVFDGVTTGCPIGFIIRNTNQHSADYNNMSDVLRPSHADYTYMMKYGVRDYRGGGRSSARETISRCVAGAMAKMALRQIGVDIYAYTSQVGELVLKDSYDCYDRTNIESNGVKCPDAEMATRMEQLILDVKGAGDTVGGVITCVIKGCPVGLGSPAFGKLHAELGHAMLTINAAKGFEYGEGFAGAKARGSEQNDLFTQGFGFASNHSGGIQGGISNGQDIVLRVAFKPVATLLQEQHTVDIYGNETILKARGRHDPCVLPRAVPIVEAMAAMVVLDQYLLSRTVRMTTCQS